MTSVQCLGREMQRGQQLKILSTAFPISNNNAYEKPNSKYSSTGHESNTLNNTEDGVQRYPKKSKTK